MNKNNFASLSVCMIVKNEEGVLERCLECVKQFANEIIIVDTLSTDKTKEIALKYTDKVFDFSWCDDFAKARNYSFSFATCDYIMWLDADDIITDTNIEKIKKVMANANADVYMAKYSISFDNNNQPTYSFFRERIVKRANNYKWVGFIHEVIPYYGNVMYTDIEIEHRKIKKSNPKRNLKIYNKHIKNGTKLDARNTYYYAKELYYNGYYRKCIRTIKKYLKMQNCFLANKIDAVVTLARCHIYLKEYEKTLNTLFFYQKNLPPHSEIYCLIGDIFNYQNNFDSAIFYYKCALLTEIDIKSGIFFNKDYYYLYPLLQLTYLYYKKGDYIKAKHYHNKCKKENPYNDKVRYNENFFSKI